MAKSLPLLMLGLFGCGMSLSGQAVMRLEPQDWAWRDVSPPYLTEPKTLRLQLPRQQYQLPANHPVVVQFLKQFQAFDVEDGIVPVLSTALPEQLPIGATTVYFFAHDHHHNQARSHGTLILLAPPENQAPQMKDVYLTIPPNSETLIQPLRNDQDPDEDVLRITKLSKPKFGKVTLEEDRQSVTYHAKANFTGLDSFYYEVSDGFGGTGFAIVVLTIASP